MIKLQIEKCWSGNKKYFKILKIEALEKVELPKEYLDTSCYAYLDQVEETIDSDCDLKKFVDALVIKDGGYSYLLKTGVVISKGKTFFDILKHIGKCGDNLKRIKDEWSGIKTITI